ncbi:histidine kinase,KaiB domain-containing protein,histidine kinase [Rivularia sp. PCC 7116]|uniref:histidine kinase n=1 Tax=Rivularia sp. PCC 7116 TaxID=373994 RepID=UPI00029ED29B|nr:histidine kinase [Rivularia sp. PCC 7116]AFY52884.1 histidine kinase,KaiB domain-containing protein,histidine kinase [Rivularia sp. PCC 7116]
MQASQGQQLINSEAPLQLLLFVDERPKSRLQIQQIRSYLQQLQLEYDFELQIIDVGKQPHLAEHFKLVATPALIKIHPEPRQVLAGSNIVSQLKTWWSRWQTSVESYLQLQQEFQQAVENDPDGYIKKSEIPTNSLAISAEIIELSDEVFRLKQEKQQLQEQLQFKDRVIGMLAHDLRNPLTATIIAIDTLKSNYNSETGEFRRLTPALTAHMLNHARTQTKVIEKMITDLLQVGRGKDTKIPISPQKIVLGDICLEVLEELRESYKAKSLEIIKDIPQDLPYVYADPERIRQVVINLLDNAIKYTPPEGTVTIAGLHRTSQKVQFSIGDSGPGIPQENRDRIFENRFRLERDEAKDGYGIGLSLCQKIVQAHYGQIWVDRAPTGGAWFHFILPVYPN